MKKNSKGNPFAIRFPGDFKPPTREGGNVLDDQDFLIKREIDRLDKEIWKRSR